MRKQELPLPAFNAMCRKIDIKWGNTAKEKKRKEKKERETQLKRKIFQKANQINSLLKIARPKDKSH